MKRMGMIVAAVFLSRALWAQGQCAAHESAVIDSEVRCVDNGGISIGFTGEEGIKVACMQDKVVQGACGPDGRLTRLRAYSAWFNKLKKFENECATEGGVFAFKDAQFIEPQDESYCLQAVPDRKS